MKLTYLKFMRASVLVSVFFGATTLVAHTGDKCVQRLRSLGSILEKVDEKISAAEDAGHLQRPNFYDFAHDRAAAETWKGQPAPLLISSLLPAGVQLIDHSLLGASERGVVKDAGSGEFVSLRVDVNGIGTNVGVSRTALAANISRTTKTFVRENAKAVMIFMHGGGTRTTGHHVGISMMNTFSPKEVDTISLDLPWHGEGPREIYRSPKEYFEWMRAFIRKYVAPSGKPIFLVGHSMGGEFADSYMRLYPEDDLVSGVMALSPPIDAVPGVELAARIRLNEKRDADIRGPESQTPEDRDLLRSLVSQNKLSFTALLFESLFSLQTSWIVPEGSKKFIPALYVWGQKDWLYVGNEAIVEKYLRPLSNVKIQVYGKRFDVVENRELDVGHLIFDHLRPGTDQLEAFLDIQEFIESVIGEKLIAQKPKSSQDDLLKKIIQTYVNNLAFREFAETYVVYRRQADREKMEALNKRGTELHSKKRTPDEDAEMKTIQALRQGAAIPEGPEGDLGRQWQAEYRKAKDEERSTQKRRDSLKTELDALRPEIKKTEKAYAKAIEGVTNSELYRASQRAEEIMNRMHEQNSQIEHAINAFYLERLNSPNASFEPTPELAELIRSYEDLTRAYAQAKREKEEIFKRMVAEGHLGTESRALYVALYEKNGLRWKEDHLNKELAELDLRIADYQMIQESLMQKLAEKYSGGLFRYESMSLKNLMNLPASEWLNYQSFFQDAWQRWILLWKERPPSEKPSLY